eukprot:g27199.t1
MHDTLAGRSRVQYEENGDLEYAPDEQKELQDKVQMYLEGDLQEIEVTSLRMVYESYAIFRKLYQNLRTELANRPTMPLPPQGGDTEAAEGGPGATATETREGEVGEDVEGKGIAARVARRVALQVGVAPANSRPPQEAMAPDAGEDLEDTPGVEPKSARDELQKPPDKQAVFAEWKAKDGQSFEDAFEKYRQEKAAWSLICRSPQIYQCDDFLSSEECEAIRSFAESAGSESWNLSFKTRVDLHPEGSSPGAAVLRALDRRIWALSGQRPHEGEMPWAVHVTPGAAFTLEPSEGGHTLFPLAHSLEEGVEASWAACGVAVAPKEGRCVAFWSRSRTGHLDPASWHGGAAVGLGSAKWTLQKFKEAPAEVLKACCIETFAMQHASLQLPCGAGAVRFVEYGHLVKQEAPEDEGERYDPQAVAWHGLPFWHGRLGSGEVWPAPALVAQEANEARPGFSSCSADEYEDGRLPNARSGHTGCGLLDRIFPGSRTNKDEEDLQGSCIYFVATANSKVKRLVTHESPEEGLEAEPTTSHRFFVALWRKKLLHHWVQQNHDGLPQKAGYPQHALNEIHGSWFDPSNPVVHFRAELRSSNFGWLLDAELPQDRLVVSAAEHAHSLGAVVVSLQRTRLDRHVQLRVFAEADHFFQLVAQELEIHLCEPEICDAPAQIVLPDLVYLAAGPSAGRALRWRRKGSMLELDGGHLMGAWWLSCQAHPCPFPLANTMSRPMRARRVIDAARLVEAPFLTGPPAAFLSGRWRGDALRLAGREAHPSAEAERAQDLCWVLVVQGEELAGVGFTTWPAAHVLCGAAGRTWHRLVGRVAEGGTFQLELTWEDVVASRRPSEPLSEQQRCGGRLCCQINGRVWWDDRHGQFLLAGLWQDEEGVSGALLMSQEPNACAGRWDSRCDECCNAATPATGAWSDWNRNC